MYGLTQTGINTMTQHKTFTSTELKQYRRYENVRESGHWNMLDPQAREATGLSRDQYSFVMKNYSALREAAEYEDKLTPNR
jgi:hypothetical protein